jgi:hypothetical protein
MSIASRQNEPLQIRRLAAARNLYARAKFALAWHMVLSVPVAIVLVLIVTQRPDLKALSVGYAIAVGLFCELWLAPQQKRLRELAAKVQEAFDCDVLALPWNTLKVGGRVIGETEIAEAERYKSWAHRISPLTDWYATRVDQIPLPIGRVCCQRINCWWDGTQRRVYARIAMGFLVLLAAAAVLIGWLSKIDFGDFMMVIVAPLIPAVLTCIRQYKEHSDAAGRLDDLMKHASTLFDEACKDPEAPQLLERSRDLQNEIYDGRKRNPPIFDWIFKRLRNRQERQMYGSTDDLVREAELRISKLGR